MAFNLENPFTDLQDLFNEDDNGTILEKLFLTESDHMLSDSYIKTRKARDLDISLRREAFSSILQFSSKFDPFLSYLAVNYMDRFLSNQQITQPKPCMLRLVAVSCFSLAAKMRQMEFSVNQFQGNGGMIFDTETIQRMEFIILGALKWRMRSITPFSFLSFFISLFNLKDPHNQEALKSRANKIIFKAQTDIKLLEFKPSIIAATAVLFASNELFPMQFPCFKKAISNCCSYVNKENILDCFNAMQETSIEESDGSEMEIGSNSDTPVNVLDGQFSSSESDKTNITTTNTN